MPAALRRTVSEPAGGCMRMYHLGLRSRSACPAAHLTLPAQESLETNWRRSLAAAARRHTIGARRPHLWLWQSQAAAHSRWWLLRMAERDRAGPRPGPTNPDPTAAERTLNSTRCFMGCTPALLKCPASGFVTLRSATTL